MALQFLSSLSANEKAAKRERSVGSRLPYAAQIDDRTLLTRDGLLMQVIHLGGFLFETADTDELNYRKGLRDAMLQALGSSRFALYHHIVRRRVDTALEADYPDSFSARLDTAWRARLGTRRLYVNDLFLTVVRRPMQGRGGIADRLSRRLTGASSAASDRAADRRALDMAVEQIVAALGHYKPRVLSAYDTPKGTCSEPLELLSMILNGEMRPVRLPEGDVGDYLPYRRISFGQDMVELGTAGDLPREFQAILSIKDYPGQTTPGMLDDLLRLPVEMVVSQSFGFVDRQAGLGRMNLALRRMRASDDEALSLRGELGGAKDDLAAGRAAFGEHHLTIAVRGTDMEMVDAHVAEVQSALTDLGLIAVREEIGLEAAYWAQFPGNFPYIARRALISSRNFASLASCHNFPSGRATGNHWGDAVTILESTAAGPYHFNFHQGDLGNFTVIGPSGSGKTVVLNFLLAQARKFDPRIIFFDKDRGAELFIRAIGGVYDILRPGMAAALNPLQIDDTPENRRFLIDWIGRLVMRPGEPLTPQELHHIQEAVDASYTAPRPHRRLRYFAQLFRGSERPHANDLWSRLRPWWGEGEHAWLFDNAEDRTDIAARTVGFDMTRILDTPTLRTPAMMYLFHRVEERLDGIPAIIVIDEGWKALDDDIFVHKIKDWEKTIRKRNGIVGFATQSAEDALSSKIASAIVEQAATQIFMANAKARQEDYCDGFGLTPHEYDLVRSLPDNAHCFLIKHGHDSVVARLNLSGESDILTILSGRERTVRLLDEIRDKLGDDPQAWLPELLRVA
ncbi:VirB4 family type IV secretion/conjugal transfer ATPase [Sphingobium yanoikuyae]|uniref:Type IV secretion system protein virB4 n=1 Tax=Sphingobium yanoikuyae TaxID=13690 RepID=A0A9X7YCP6_SPHYA|nr:VirB4 family type IV secretion/conjugal transfer ATPase [Sphingobium yanoikuyae]QNG45760.1 VirB4 family type IV secretion/conjugal transfer ATPase [Sphingobium yanoikuyae]